MMPRPNKKVNNLEWSSFSAPINSVSSSVLICGFDNLIIEGFTFFPIRYILNGNIIIKAIETEIFILEKTVSVKGIVSGSWPKTS